MTNAKANPFKLHFIELLLRLNTLSGSLSHIDNHLNNFRDMFRQRHGTDRDVFALFQRHLIDLTEWPEVIYHQAGSFMSEGEEYLNMVDVLIAREAAWTVAQAYEAFETFLKDTISQYLHQYPGFADKKKLSELSSRLSKSSRTGIEYWREFIRYGYRKNSELLQYLRKQIPDLKKIEQQNNRAVDLTEWYEVVEKVRHAVTHSNLIIKIGQIKRWPQKTQLLLDEFFPGEHTAIGFTLKIDRKHAEDSVELFAEYAFAIFKCLSLSKDYDWNLH